MDTDVKSSAWFDYPQPGYYSNPGLSYFPAFQGTPFVLKKTEAFPGLSSNVLKVNDITTNNVDHRTPSSTNSPNRAASTPLYKMYVREIIKEAIRWKGSFKAKFRHEITSDCVRKGNGNVVSVPVIIQNTSGMNEYENQSFEEIRFEDYLAFSMQNREEDADRSFMDPKIAKNPERESSTRLKQIEILSQPPLLNPLLLNATQEKNLPSQKTVSESNAPIFDESTTSLLQALMNNVKQSVDVNYLSEEAKHNCATLLHALADFTEKTLENLTVIVLEDMLRSIKQRKVVSSPAKADKCTSTKACAEPNSTQTENDVEKTHEPIPVHAKKQSRKGTNNKYEDDCSSDCQDVPVEKDERSVGNQPESVYELVDKYIKTNRKKNTPSISAIFAKASSSIPRSSRHSHSGSGRSTEKANRHKGLHRKYSDEKYSNFREKTTYDDSDNEEFLKRNDDLKRSGKRDDGWGTAPRAKHNKESFRRRKKNSKKVQFVLTDECRICEGLGRVSINDCERKEGIAVKEKTPYCKEHVYETSEKLTEKENERRRPDRSVETTSANSTESTVAQDEYESQSYSDSSSI